MCPRRVSGWTLVRAGLGRCTWQVVAGIMAAMVAAGALFAAGAIFLGTRTQLAGGLGRLGADLILVPRGQREAVTRYLQEGGSLSVAGTAPIAEWVQQITKARVVGIEAMEGQGGALLIRLDGWASPLLAAQEIEGALPDAEVVPAEQAARRVGRDLQPLLGFLGPASGVALLGAVHLTALLTAIRVSERRRELGMLRAAGASWGWIMGLTLGEVGLIAAAGSLAGVLLAGGAVVGGLALPLPAGQGLLLGLGAAGATVAATMAGALGPALRAGALDPLDAARRG